ncbi:hypothetical protein BJX65DRAFT_315317 [Aspergillus insuetus]
MPALKATSILESRQDLTLRLKLGLKKLAVLFASCGDVDWKSHWGKHKAISISGLDVPVRLATLGGYIKSPGNLCHVEHLAAELTRRAPCAITGRDTSQCWIAVRDISGLYAFSVIYRIAAAAVQSLYPAACACLTVDLGAVGVRTGMILTIVSFAALTGAPIAGALVERGGGRYLYARVFAAVSTAVGGGLVFGARVVRRPSGREGGNFKGSK